MRLYLLPLLGVACSLTLNLSPANSQGAPGEVGETLQASAPGETGPSGLKLAEIGETGGFAGALAEGIGEAGPILQLSAEPGETGEMGLQHAQAEPGESGPPAVLQH